MSAAQGQAAPTRTHTTSVDLPAELTTPLPEDASLVTIAARTAAETAFGVPGVHRLGGLIARAADTVRAAVGRSAASLGVRVDDEDGRLDVSVGIVVEYPFGVVAVADEVRRQVRAALGQLRSGETRVDVRVLDVHGPFDPVEEPAGQESSPRGDTVDTEAATATAATASADATADTGATAAADAEAPSTDEVVDAPVATAVPDADAVAAADRATTPGDTAATAPAAAAGAAVAAADAAVAAADAAVAAADAVTTGDGSAVGSADTAETPTGASATSVADTGTDTAETPFGADDTSAPESAGPTGAPTDAADATALANGVEPTEPRS